MRNFLTHGGAGWVAAIAVVLGGCGGGVFNPLSDNVAGHCEYTGRFSGRPECKEYRGEWTEEEAKAECVKAVGTFAPGVCPMDGQGACEVTANPKQERVVLTSTDPNDCGNSKLGCDVFARGNWRPSELCGGKVEVSVIEDAFPMPVKSCKPPKEGEPAGKGPDGKVCTWESMQGATEEGRLFTDYASCRIPLRQRSFRYKEPNERYEKEKDDPRLKDPAYLAEEKWVKEQVRPQSCVCCHAAQSPGGVGAVFDIDRPGSFGNQFNDLGLAQGAGWVSTVVLGTLPPEDNNGFERATPEHPDRSAFMTTDQDRMRRFFENELKHRGFSKADFATIKASFGPLSDQYEFRPKACTEGEGVEADGTLTWEGGRARYIWVMEAESTSPTVPPNLDTPEGTLWRLDVPDSSTQPLRSGTVQYGVAAEGAGQAFPVKGAPAALVSGKTYYLYVSADVLMPITRCLFVAP